MAKRQAFLLNFCQVHIRDKDSLRRRLMMLKTKNLMTRMYRLKIAQKNLEMNLNCHVLIDHISTLIPKFLVIFVP